MFLFLCSVKWVGLFVILLVGLMTVKDLWDLLGDIRIPMVSLSLSMPLCTTLFIPDLISLLPQSGIVKHFLARSLCLILLPVLIYTGVFGLHLLALRYRSALVQ